jgi:hypothetical protein
MRSLVVCESWFGNTRQIAEEIADAALGGAGEAEVLSVDDPLPSLDGVDLIVVGAPTHVHGLSSGRSRKAALDQGGRGAAPGIGVSGWIDQLPESGGLRAAVFDTRSDMPVLLVGSAARRMARRLRKRGYRLAAEPESFFVHGTPGPLQEGELERAAKWGRELVTSA